MTEVELEQQQMNREGFGGSPHRRKDITWDKVKKKCNATAANAFPVFGKHSKTRMVVLFFVLCCTV